MGRGMKQCSLLALICNFAAPMDFLRCLQDASNTLFLFEHGGCKSMGVVFMLYNTYTLQNYTIRILYYLCLLQMRQKLRQPIPGYRIERR